MEKATAGTAMARSQNHQREAYANQDCQSRANLFEQAAEILLLSECPQSTTSRMAFMALFERRLRRVYEGATR
jgi:hypothetical protein